MGVFKQTLLKLSLLFLFHQYPARGMESPSYRQVGVDHRPDVTVRLRTVKNGLGLSGVDFWFTGMPRQPQNLTNSLKIAWRVDRQQRYSWQVLDRHSGRLITRLIASSLNLSGSSLRLDSSAHFESIPNRVSFVPRGQEDADLIATMDLESYLLGVIPAEMPIEWPLEALKAQAIAARTYALFKKNENRSASFELESTVLDQVYRPEASNTGSKELRAKLMRVIEETKGMVLVGKNRAPIAAYYHADCGGKTEEASQVWGEEGKSVGTAVDQNCPFSPTGKWSFELDKKYLSMVFQKIFSHEESAQLSSVRVAARTASGRVRVVTLEWNDGRQDTLSGHQFRRAIGFSKLRSTQFLINEGRVGKIQFQGRGYGHGVGMCQWGARALAQSGKSYIEILNHYYPNAKVQKFEFKSSKKL